MDVQNVAIEMITVKNRYRKDLGDLEGLKESIKERGLLQPIMVTSSWVLVFGERRLEACRALGWSEIPAIVVDIEALLFAERDENVERKDFTVSEKTAIAQACMDWLKKNHGERRGRPRKDDSNGKNLQPSQNGHGDQESLINGKNDEKTWVEKNRNGGSTFSEEEGRATEIAAKEAGFGSKHSLEMAERLKDLGSQDLRDAVDDGTVSLTDAASICSEQPDVQDEAVRRVAHGTFKTVKHAAKIILAERQAVNDQADVIKDSNGILIPDTLRQYYEAIPQFEEIATKAKEVRLLLSALDRTLASSHVNTKQLQSYLKTIESDMERNRFGIVCPACEGVDGANCNCCQNKRWFRECDKDIDLKKWRKGK